MTLDTFDREIAELRAQIARIERTPPSFDEAWAPVAARMDAAEQAFNQHGLPLDLPQQMTPEYARQRHLALAGAVLAGNRKAIETGERGRVKARRWRTSVSVPSRASATSTRVVFVPISMQPQSIRPQAMLP